MARYRFAASAEYQYFSRARCPAGRRRCARTPIRRWPRSPTSGRPRSDRDAASRPCTRACWKRCHRGGRTKPTPLLLHYEAGGCSCLHHGHLRRRGVSAPAHVLPEPARVDYEAATSCWSSSGPRAQSRGESIATEQGGCVIFATPPAGAEHTRLVSRRHAPRGQPDPERARATHSASSFTTPRDRVAGRGCEGRHRRARSAHDRRLRRAAHTAAAMAVRRSRTEMPRTSRSSERALGPCRFAPAHAALSLRPRHDRRLGHQPGRDASAMREHRAILAATTPAERRATHRDQPDCRPRRSTAARRGPSSRRPTVRHVPRPLGNRRAGQQRSARRRSGAR